ncbi:hypothetical protein T07_10942, partial [Trichinella nelsoni]
MTTVVTSNQNCISIYFHSKSDLINFQQQRPYINCCTRKLNMKQQQLQKNLSIILIMLFVSVNCIDDDEEK